MPDLAAIAHNRGYPAYNCAKPFTQWIFLASVSRCFRLKWNAGFFCAGFGIGADDFGRNISTDYVGNVYVTCF
ncbi:MAG: SBBP repeat-containing protein [Terasakiella sp.]|uniref:SBBP repeat-containing protein n=1 Tax=Terasakiella sp. TaxID=2034861 RepID=UPI003AFF727E